MTLLLAIRNESTRKRLYRTENLRQIGQAILDQERPHAKKSAAPCELSVLLCDDPFIAELNQQYRNKTGPTDVLSFAQDSPGDGLPDMLGDIVISLETVERFCKGDAVAMRDEVRLLFCHGLLHLLGYDHGTEAEQERMNTLQAQYLGISQEAAWHAHQTAPKAAQGARTRGGAR